jgi:hypothetical protein
MAEYRIVHERMTRHVDFLAGVDINHRRHRLGGGVAERRYSAQRRLDRSFPGSDDLDVGPCAPRQQIGTQRGYHEQDAEADRGGLRKDEPKSAHGMLERLEGGSLAGLLPKFQPNTMTHKVFSTFCLSFCAPFAKIAVFFQMPAGNFHVRSASR